MNSISTRVYLLGFDPGDLKDWQEHYGLEPVEVSLDALNTLPQGVPIVVHTDRAAELAEKVDAEGILRDVILYVPSGSQRPQRVSFDAVVHEADLSRLRELVTHAEQLRMARLAHDVPLSLLTRQVQDLDLQHLGLPQQDAAHLANCLICPNIFREALRERVQLYQRLSCPSPGELIEYASTGKISDGRLAAHMQRCPLCSAQLETLRSAISNQPTTIPAVNVIASIGIARRKRAHPGKVLIEVPVTTRLGDTISSLSPKFDQDLDDLRTGL
jgi:hypothetical protein